MGAACYSGVGSLYKPCGVASWLLARSGALIEPFWVPLVDILRTFCGRFAELLFKLNHLNRVKSYA